VLIDRVIDARLAGAEGRWSVALADGQVVEIAGAPSDAPRGHRDLDAAGCLLVPAFVDAHVHLDKAFLLEDAGPLAPHLEAAIDVVAKLRALLPLGRVLANAERAVDRLVQHGVTAARAHVEIDPVVGLDLVHLHRALAEAVAPRLELQLVAFPQRGLEAPGMVELMAAAMAEGLEVVGGCPYVDADPKRHLDRVFALAARHGAPIDLHLDFSDDPRRSLLDLVAERTRAHGMQGRVTIGHVTTLAAMALDEQASALDLLAASGIALVVLPATDLYLAGHGEPGTRSLAPLERARVAGVRVAIANNNMHNPFSPFGNGSLVQAAWLTGIVQRAAAPATRAWLFEAITSEPAVILGLAAHGPTAGSPGHLALLDAQHVDEVVLHAPPVLATVRAGRLVHALNAPRMRG